MPSPDELFFVALCLNYTYIELSFVPLKWMKFVSYKVSLMLRQHSRMKKYTQMAMITKRIIVKGSDKRKSNFSGMSVKRMVKVYDDLVYA